MVVLSSLVPAAFLLVRDTPWLSTLNVWAALGLIAVGSTLRPECCPVCGVSWLPCPSWWC
ncbi:MAG: hypothetical protein GY698_07535 [Actinomycetia bacterium]|nr:hypothetical protein [Actinomycetes bacterium]